MEKAYPDLYKPPYSKGFTGRDHRFAHVHAEDGRSLRCIFLPRAKNYLSPAEEDAGFDLISPAEMQAQIFEMKGGDSLKHG